MSYGFEARNASGAVVIDSQFPSMFLGEETSVTGVELYANVYKFSLSQTGYAPFFNVPVGDWVTYSAEFDAGEPAFYGSKSVFSIRKAVFLEEISYTPSGYGLAVYDSLGNPLFSSSENLIPVVGFTNDLENKPTEGQFSKSVEWVCPLGSEWVFGPATPPFNALANQCIKRVTNNSFETTLETILLSTDFPTSGSGGNSVKAMFAG